MYNKTHSICIFDTATETESMNSNFKDVTLSIEVQLLVLLILNSILEPSVKNTHKHQLVIRVFVILALVEKYIIPLYLHEIKDEKLFKLYTCI